MMKFYFCILTTSAHKISKRYAEEELPQVTAVESMVSHFAPDAYDAGLSDYGCVGRGHFNSSAVPAGVPQDELDGAFLWWKKCIHCAKNDYNQLTFQYAADIVDDFYRFDEENETCENNIGTIKRAMCECDRTFAIKIRDTGDLFKTSGFLGKTDVSDCPPFEPKLVNTQCCLNERQGYFTMYNPNSFCCEDGIVQEIGTCFA